MILFLLVYYIIIQTTLRKAVFFYRTYSNLKSKKILIISPSKNTRSRSNDKITIYTEFATITSSPSYFLLSILLTLRYKPCLTTPNSMFTNNTKNWLISIQRHSDYQRIPRCSKKKLKRLHQNSLKNISIFIHLPHTLEKLLRRLFSETGLAEN